MFIFQLIYIYLVILKYDQSLLENYLRTFTNTTAPYIKGIKSV